MKRTFAAVALATVFLASAVSAQTTSGWLSSYWDGCKPTCSWYQNLSSDPRFLQHGLSRSCDINNNELPLGEIAEAQCAKEGGPAHSCWDQIPFVDPSNPNLAYGFGATATAVCGQCFEVTFTGEYESGSPMPMHKALAGKKAIIMGRNTGGVAGNQIDFLIPGGGLGDFDCLSPQLGLPQNSDKLGQRFGGLLRNCIDGAISQFGGNWDAPGLLDWVQNCHRQGCNTAFGDFPVLLEGCMFHVDWMMSAPNPKATVVPLNECPQILVNGYVPKSSKYTLLRKFMEFTSSTGNPSINPGNKTVSSVNSNVTLTYNDVKALTAGPYKLSVAIATSEATIISVNVNGQSVITSPNVATGNWSPFTVVELGEVDLVAGNNTIVFSFQSNSVNIDYFLLLGKDPSSSVKQTVKGGASPTVAGIAINARSGAVVFSAHDGRSIKNISVHDLRGRRVFNRTAGEAKVTWNSSRQPKGMYVVRMVMDNGVAVQRNLMLK